MPNNELELLMLEKERRSRQGRQSATPQRPTGSFQEVKDLFGSDKSLGRKAWDALSVPEQMSKRGLQGMANMIPEGKITGNMPMDILRGTPRIAANTLAQAAPGFVSRGSILTAGAMPLLKSLAPAAGAIGKGIGGQLEQLGGMKPGLLTEAFKDPSLIFSYIPKEARQAYQALNESEAIATSPLKSISSPLRMVNKALKMAESGSLSPEEALEARKEVDKLYRSRAVTEVFKNTARKTLDVVAKSSKEIAGADKGFARGMKASQLRNLFPQNKYGGASPFKMMMGEILAKSGPIGKIGTAAMSPLAMGSAATGLGAATKAAAPLVNNPSFAVALQQALQRFRQTRENPNP